MATVLGNKVPAGHEAPPGKLGGFFLSPSKRPPPRGQHIASQRRARQQAFAYLDPQLEGLVALRISTLT